MGGILKTMKRHQRKESNYKRHYRPKIARISLYTGELMCMTVICPKKSRIKISKNRILGYYECSASCFCNESRNG